MVTVFTTISIIISTVLTYLGLSNEVMTLYACLLFIDFLTGIGKSLVMQVEITVKRMKVGVITKMSMLFLPITLAITAKIGGVEAQKVFEWGLILLAVSEAYGVFSNVYTMKTGKYLPKADAIALIGEKLRFLITKQIKD